MMAVESHGLMAAQKRILEKRGSFHVFRFGFGWLNPVLERATPQSEPRSGEPFPRRKGPDDRALGSVQPNQVGYTNTMFVT